MADPLPAYQGDEPYAFVCYSHEDSDVVYAEMRWLSGQGINLWYDEGISAGTNWRAATGDHLLGARHVVFYISQRSLESEHCNREINLALDEGKDIVPVYLEDVDLTSDLKVGLNRVQAVHRYALEETAYRSKLTKALGLSSKEPTATAQPRTHQSKRWIRPAGVLAALVLLGGMFFVGRISDPEDQPRLPNSIAVLPFANLSPDPDDAYFAAGMHEEILNQLVKIKELSVIARTSVLVYAGSAKRVPEIARELNVSTVMEGSVRYAGEHVRITAQLIDADTGVQLWSEAYDRNLEDIFAIQSDIALSVTDALKVQFSLAERESVNRPPTDNLDAYAHYVRAMAKFTEGTLVLQPVLDELDAAIRLDPDFALALATKAYVHGLLIYANIAADPTVAIETAQRNARLALELADHALAIDPDQGKAYVARALIDAFYRRWDEQFENISTGHRRNPNDFTVVSYYAQELAKRGRLDEAIGHFERAIALDPKNPSIRYYAALTLDQARSWGVAKTWMQEVIEQNPGFDLAYIQMAGMAEFTGDSTTAESMLAAAEPMVARAIDPSRPTDTDAQRLLVMMDVYARLGRQDDVARLHEWVLRLADVRPLNDGQLFHLYHDLGDADRAMHHLTQTIDNNYPSGYAGTIRFGSRHPWFEHVRDRPDFQELLRKVDVPLR